MAIRSLLIAVMTLLVVGCQPTSTISQLPSPNFNGPTVLAAAPTVAWTPTPAPTPTKTKTRGGLQGIPASWIPSASAEKRDWTWIVIHHSATPNGSAAKFNREHQAKGWDELGYHFVIGNGDGSGNGQIEVGPRWPKQKWGAHAKTADNKFNEHGIGICLVGNFDNQRPTAAQMASLNKLTAYLMKTYNVPPQRILGHGQTKATDCPGKNLSITAVRSGASKVLANAGETIPGVRTASGAELLQDVAR